METCPTCGVERRRVGVLCPARSLCRCEIRVCGECTKRAVMVEFQRPVSGKEPVLPDANNDVVNFFCASHAPFELPKSAIIPLKGGKLHGALPAPRKKLGKPHVAPEWENAAQPPPAGASDTTLVECSSCKDTHPMNKRVMFNGTRSECPKCGHTVHTLSWKEED